MKKLLFAALFCPMAAAAAVDRAFLRELLEIPSMTADIPSVNRATDLTRTWLARHGVRCQVETDDEGRKILWAATVEGKTPDYVLVGHLDVVPAEPDQFKVRFDGNRVYARGAHDNKGNAALTCDVLRRLNGKASVGAIFAANEEIGGSTVAFMVKRGYRPRKMGIVLDAGTYGVYYAQKGNAYLTVRATGKGGHSSCALWLDNPIEKLMRGYETFKRNWPAAPKDGWGDLVVPTVVRAGQTENVIPDTAEMVLNVRAVSTDAVERVTAAIEQVPGLKVVKVCLTGQPMASDPNDPEILRLLAERRARWPGKNAELSKMLAITDARHLAGLGVPVVIIGSIGGNAHGRDEWGDLRNMDENADSLVAFIGGGKPGETFHLVALDRLQNASESVMVTAVVQVTGPDHLHAYDAVKALRGGEKALVASPAARTVEEARLLFAEAARHPGCLAVGDLGPVSAVDAATIEKVRAFGSVRSVTVSCRTTMAHLGTRRPIGAKQWTPICPDGATWNRWIGVMPLRPFYPLYVENEGWRAFLDFGTGPLGRDGARLLRPVFRALALGAPLYAERLSVDGAAPDRETYPKAAAVRFVFTGGVELVWRHGPDVETSVVWRNDRGETRATEPSAPVASAEQLAALERGDALPPETAAITETILLGCRAMMTDRRVTTADCEKRYVRDGWEW